MKRFYALLLAVICSVGMGWADINVGFEDDSNGIKLWVVPTNGDGFEQAISHGRTNDIQELGNIKALYLKEWYAKLYQNADELNQVADFHYNIYNADITRTVNFQNETNNYFIWHDWSDGWRKPTVGNNGLDVNLLDGLGSGNYILEYYFTAQQKPETTIYNSNGGANFKVSFTILPPAVTNLTLTGAIFGNGDGEDHPYIIPHGRQFSVSVEPANTDPNSQLQVKFNGEDIDPQNTTFNYDGLTQITAMYHCNTAELEGDNATIYVASAYDLYLWHNWNGQYGRLERSSQPLDDNGDGTLSLYAQYGAGSSTEFRFLRSGHEQTTINNVTLEGTPETHDYCEFKVDFNGTEPALTIRKLPTGGTLGTNGWSTFYAVSNFRVTGASAYIATTLANNTVTLTEVTGVIPGSTAIVLKGTEDAEYTIDYTLDDPGASVSSNKLHGTGTRRTTASLTPEGKTFMALKSDVGEFWKYNGQYFPANKAFLLVDHESEGDILSVSVRFDDFTAVENTAAEIAVKFIENGQLFIQKNGTIYNSLGQAVK